MRWAGVMLAVLIAGCAADRSRAPLDLPLRDPAVPLGGTTRFDTTQFQGDWHTIACIGSCVSRESYILRGDMLMRQTAAGQAAYVAQGSGALKPAKGPVLVVMWVDEGFRTAAIGDSGGAWAAIIDRHPAATPDRLAAAAEILDFYGWDISRLQRID